MFRTIKKNKTKSNIGADIFFRVRRTLKFRSDTDKKFNRPPKKREREEKLNFKEPCSTARRGLMRLHDA